jgi:hypothetical protein
MQLQTAVRENFSHCAERIKTSQIAPQKKDSMSFLSFFG